MLNSRVIFAIFMASGINIAASIDCPPLIYKADYFKCNNVNSSNYPIVMTSSGPIGGKCSKSVDSNVEYCSWKGIPYAEPPIGDLRFRIPVDPPSWNSTRWGFDFGNVCIQLLPVLIGSEDCLFLNVYAPKGKCTESSPCPVMVYIYGGGFIVGSGNSDFYGPDHFMVENVVLITFNYRMGAFGFLSSEDENLPGNVGMMDQIKVLQWIQENISGFGGDKQSVTLIGESAGAISACLHCMSDLSADLFHRIILQSGNCLSDITLSRKPRKILEDLARKLVISYKNFGDLTEKLRYTNAEEILKASLQIFLEKFDIRTISPFVPTIDVMTPSFLPDKPSNIIRRKLANRQAICHGASMISGMNLNEGGLFKISFLLKPFYLLNLPSNKEVLTPLKCNSKRGSPASKAVAEKIYNRYYKTGATQWNYYRYVTSMLFIDGTEELFKSFIQSGSPPYLYILKYCGTTNYARNILFPHTSCEQIGSIHTDEYFFQFTQTGITIPNKLEPLSDLIKTTAQSVRTPKEITLIRQIIKSFVNFAKFGDPTPGTDADSFFGIKWEPINNISNIRAIDFDMKLAMSHHSYSDDIQFWASICDV